MGLLTAPVAFLEPLAVDVRSAFGPLGDLLQANDPDIIRFHCTSIKEDMEDSAFSGWFSLLVRAVFRYVSEDDAKFELLLAAVSHVNEASAPALRELRRITIAQHRDLLLKIVELRQEQSRLMRASFYTGSNEETILDRDEKLTAEIVGLEARKKPMLALFLIVEKIIVILQELNYLNPERENLIKQRITEDPIKFMVQLIPILGLLQKGESGNLTEVIALTLQLVDLYDAALPPIIQEELLKRKWVELNTLQEAPEKQVAEDDQEDAQTDGCCLVRAVSHLFFREKRRGNRVAPHDALQQKTNVSDIVSVYPEGPQALSLTTATATQLEFEIEEEKASNEGQINPTHVVEPPGIHVLPSRPRKLLGAVELLDTIDEEDDLTLKCSC